MSNETSEAVPGGQVSTTKSVERQGGGLVVQYELESTGSVAVEVTVSDRMPTENVGDFGFREAYHPSEWSHDGEELQLVATLESGAERTFVFAVVADGEQAVPFEPSTPTIHVDDGSTDESRDGEAGDADESDGGFFDEAAHPLLDDETDQVTEGADEVAVDAALDLEEPGQAEADGADASDANASDVDGPDDGHAAGGTDDGSDGVVAALLRELDGGAATDSERAALGEHLGVDRPRSEAVRLDYVQKRMSDFDAYVDALEESLSVHGSGRDAIAELDERLSDLASDLEDVERRQATVLERLEELTESVESNAAGLEDARQDHEENLEDVREELRQRDSARRDDLDETRQTLESHVDALEAELEGFETIRRRLLEDLRLPAESADSSEAVSRPEPATGGATEAGPEVGVNADENSTAAVSGGLADDPDVEGGSEPSTSPLEAPAAGETPLAQSDGGPGRADRPSGRAEVGDPEDAVADAVDDESADGAVDDDRTAAGDDEQVDDDTVDAADSDPGDDAVTEDAESGDGASIFAIGEVGSDGTRDETPTIDFEDP